MKVKATLYIQKCVWIEEEVVVESEEPTIGEAIEDAYSQWRDLQEDSNDPRVDYNLDDWGYEILKE